MSKVNLVIGGRDYAVACAPGEEGHVVYLGQLIDEKLDSLPPATAQSETRSLLFAALLLADELSELREAALAPAADPEQEAALARIAARLEGIAAQLEAPL